MTAEEGFFCSELSLEAGEPLAGTAPEDGRVYFLLRHGGAWAPKPLETEGLPRSLRQTLSKRLKKIPGARLQLVRGKGGVEVDPPELWVARTAPHHRRFVHRHAFDSFRSLEGISLEALAEGEASGEVEVVEEPLFLVCTHGKRDACCAARGPEVYRAFAELDGARVLQSSHLGGHRFAPVVTELPSGLCYGRVEASAVPSFLAAAMEARIADLRHLRGRSGWPAAVQAAEIFARTASSELDDGALTFVSDERISKKEYRVVFRGAGGVHTLRVESVATDHKRPKSCGDRPKPIQHFQLLDHSFAA